MAGKSFEFVIHDEFGGPFAEDGNVSFSVLNMSWIVDGDEKEPKMNIRSYRNKTDGSMAFNKGGIALTEDQFNELILKGIEMGYGINKKNLKKSSKKSKSSRDEEDDDIVEETKPKKKKTR